MNGSTGLADPTFNAQMSFKQLSNSVSKGYAKMDKREMANILQ